MSFLGSGRKVMYVQPRERGKGWEAKWDTSRRASYTGKKKSKIVKKARKLCKKKADKGQKIQLIIKKSDGTIQKDHTFPRKSDPFPPRG